MQHQRLDRFFLGLFLYRLYGFLFVHLNQTHQQIAMLRNFLHPHRMNPGFIHMTGNFHHITILKTGDASLIFYGKHQIASVLALQPLDAVKHNACISHAIRHFQLPFFQKRALCKTGFDTHVGILTNLHIVQENLQCAFGIGVHIHRL